MPIPVIRAQVSGLQPSEQRSNIVSIEEFTITSYANQTDIVFPTGKSYVMGSNSTFLFVDGKLINKSKYTEESANTLRTKFPIAENLEITVKWFRYNSSEPASQGNIIASEQEPGSLEKIPGLIWLKPSQKKLSVWTGSEFEDFATQRSVDALTTNPNIANDKLVGGTF